MVKSIDVKLGQTKHKGTNKIVLLIVLLVGCVFALFYFKSPGSEVQINEQQAGPITPKTAFDETALLNVLGKDFRLNYGMRMNKDELVSFYLATSLTNPEYKLTINSQQKGKISTIEITNPDWRTQEGGVGSVFSDIYSASFDYCRATAKEHEDNLTLLCQSPRYPSVRYVFEGHWLGDETRLPDNETLAPWKMVKLIWFADVPHDQFSREIGR